MRSLLLVAPILVAGCSLFAAQTDSQESGEVTDADAENATTGGANDSKAIPENAGECDLDALRKLSRDLTYMDNEVAVRRVWPAVQGACRDALTSMAVPAYAPTMVGSMPSPPAPDAAYRSMSSLACPEWDQIGSEVRAAPAPARGLKAFKACDFGRFEVMSADEVAWNPTSGLISWGLHAWMLDQGLEAEHAKRITRVLLSLEAYTTISPFLPHILDLPNVEASTAADIADVQVLRAFIDVGGESVVKIEDDHIVEADKEGHLLPKLFDALSKQAAAERAAVGESWDARLVLAVDGNTRFDTLVDVMYTAGRAGFVDYAFVVEPRYGLGPRLLPIRASQSHASDDPALDGAPFMTVEISASEISMGHGAGSELSRTFTSDLALTDIAKFAEATAESDPEAHHAFISASPETAVNGVLATAARIRGPNCESNDASTCVLPTVHLVGGGAHRITTPRLSNLLPVGEGDLGEHGKGAATIPAKTPVARVRPQAVKVAGDLDPNIIRRIVRSRVSEVRSCYSKSLAKDPTSSGMLTLALRISSTGSVDKAPVASTTLKDREVGKCTAAAAKLWKFPKPRSGSVKVTYPFELTSG